MGKPETSHIQSFHYLKDGSIDFSGIETLLSCRELSPGLYALGYAPYPRDQVTLRVLDTLEKVEASDFLFKEKIDALVNAFFKPNVRSYLDELGFTKKVGVLFYGKEGTGKSTIIKHYALQLVQNSDAIVFYITEVTYLKQVWEFVERIRQLQSNPIVIVLDELDNWTEGNEGLLKQILDGPSSIQSCITFASTNYIDKIPATLRRPSRFKYILPIGGITSTEKVCELITKMLGKIYDPTQIAVLATELTGQTLDEIKQACLDKVMELEAVSVRQQIGFKPSIK